MNFCIIKAVWNTLLAQFYLKKWALHWKTRIREISAHDASRSTLRTELLTPAVCTRISHPCAPPAHPNNLPAAGQGGHLQRWLWLVLEAHVPALPASGRLGRDGQPLPLCQGSACSLPPSIPPSRGITHFRGADSEFGKAGTPSRQGGDEKVLFKVCFLSVFKCHICFV